MDALNRIGRRLLARLNIAGLRGYITSARSWVDEWNRANLNLRAVQPAAWYESLEQPQNRFIDFSLIKPVTPSDRLLKASVSLNAHTRSRQKDLFCIHHGRILGQQGAVVSPDNRLFCEFTYNYGSYRDNPVFLRKRIPKCQVRKGNFISLVYPDSANYYHWLIESLPNLRFLKPIIPSLDGVFVPAPKQFHIDSLKAIGIQKEKLIPLDSDAHYQCDRLYVTSFTYGYNVNHETVRWLRECFVVPSRGNSAVRLFISRDDSGSRKGSNEAAVAKLLIAKGFTIVQLSTLSMAEQAQLFNQAEVVVAPHGAGLANIVFCKPGTKVLEIFPPRWTPCCYLQLAQAANLDYSFMIAAESTGIGAENYLETHGFAPIDEDAPNKDMEIPLDKLSYFCSGL